ncbi:diguanylate cyclase [Fusibacter ferrireducens]|uniref:Diguanylate cyclase n=1 Tax=Fusibacter ferrireducens TaxID=2785058 RepID=A0ABR9ZMJ4_9FIRM|nr:diguanylate cyclase [Fusibacter ferrireducens]MBF4691692.1 diguanylate cyclase [Fusibacter ferrireducens]
MKSIRGFAVAITIVVLMLAYYVNTNDRVTPPMPVKGYLDLRDWSFEKDGVVSLAGEWAFYFNEFLEASDFDSDTMSRAQYIVLPSNANTMNAVKPFVNNRFYGTMRLVIDLPENSQIYGLRSDIVLSAYKLYVNDIYMGEVGNVGKDRESSLPYYKPLDSYFSVKDNRVELIYHTSDFYFEDCAITPPQIGFADQITQSVKLGFGRDLFLFGMLLTMGLYHIGLSVIRKKDQGPLFFGIFCLMFGLRMLIVGSRVLPTLLPLSFSIYFRVAYMTVFLGVLALSAFLYVTFEALFPKIFIKVSLYFTIISIVVAAVASYKLLSIWIVPYAVVEFTLMGYAIFVLIEGKKRGTHFAGWVLLGFVCIVFTFLNDFIYETTLANRASMIPLGLTVFIMTQAYTLSAKFSNAFASVEKLSGEKEALLLEMKHVNANLENIVENRTRDLREALAEMDLMSKTDYLTKLPNRRLMIQKIEALVQEKQDFFVAIADIDKFKIVNDTYGHDKGDIILQDLSRRLTKALEGIGFVGRWGGEEFMIVLYGSDSIKALRSANTIRESIASKYNIIIHSPITITIGICAYNDKITLDTAIANADKALYEGKLGGRNQCRLYRM